MRLQRHSAHVNESRKPPDCRGLALTETKEVQADRHKVPAGLHNELPGEMKSKTVREQARIQTFRGNTELRCLQVGAR